jgi:hypothetical protein
VPAGATGAGVVVVSVGGTGGAAPGVVAVAAGGTGAVVTGVVGTVSVGVVGTVSVGVVGTVSVGVVVVSVGVVVVSVVAVLVVCPVGAFWRCFGSGRRVRSRSRSVGAPPSWRSRCTVSAGRPVGTAARLRTAPWTVPRSVGWIGR